MRGHALRHQPLIGRVDSYSHLLPDILSVNDVAKCTQWHQWTRKVGDALVERLFKQQECLEDAAFPSAVHADQHGNFARVERDALLIEQFEILQGQPLQHGCTSSQ